MYRSSCWSSSNSFQLEIFYIMFFWTLSPFSISLSFSHRNIRSLHSALTHCKAYNEAETHFMMMMVFFLLFIYRCGNKMENAYNFFTLCIFLLHIDRSRRVVIFPQLCGSSSAYRTQKLINIQQRFFDNPQTLFFFFKNIFILKTFLFLWICLTTVVD